MGGPALKPSPWLPSHTPHADTTTRELLWTLNRGWGSKAKVGSHAFNSSQIPPGKNDFLPVLEFSSKLSRKPVYTFPSYFIFNLPSMYLPMICPIYILHTCIMQRLGGSYTLDECMMHQCSTASGHHDDTWTWSLVASCILLIKG